jgi:hypothetical protein
MRLAIADPPYPPMLGAGGRKNRASRWYGNAQRSTTDRAADRHDDAAEWDDPLRHRLLLEHLVGHYDGWAIATSPDGVAAYGLLPAAARVMCWVKPNAMPGAHRLRSSWEAVIVLVPEGRRSNRGGRGQISDVLVAPVRRLGFKGAKPDEWTWWVLEALGYADGDTLDDLFPGSGAVGSAASRYPIRNPIPKSRKRAA